MNLGFLFGYQNTPATGQAGSGGAQGFIPTGPPADMAALRPGQTIQGEVVAVRNNDIILQLEDGGQIAAKLTKDIPINIGQAMTFEVKSNSGTRLSLSPLFENMGHDPNALKALTAANLPATAANLDMVSLLMRQGMSVDKHSLLDFARQMAAHPTANPATLAQMNRAGIIINPENIRQFEAYQNYSHQISGAVREITDGLINEIGRMAAGGDSDGALSLFRQVLTIFGGGEGVLAATVAPDGSDIGAPAVSDGEGAALGGANGAVTADPATTPVTAYDISPADGTSAPAEALMAAPGDSATLLAQLTPESREQLTLLLRAAGFSEELTDMVNKAAVPENTATTADNPNVTPADPSPLPTAPENAATATPAHQATLTDTVNNAPAQPIAPPLTPPSLLDMLARELTAADSSVDSSRLAALFGDKDFQALFKDDLSRRWLLKPEEVARDGQVREYFRQVHAQTSRLTEALSEAGRGATPLAQSVSNLSANIHFINQLNQNFTYIQLPLQMGGKETHGELFIYTNKKNLAKNDGNISALLHLDMEHLGPLDVHVAMQNRHVQTKFYLADEAIIDLIARHIHILNERLGQRGYSVSSDLVARAADRQPVDEIMAAGANVSVIGSYSFDARA